VSLAAVLGGAFFPGQRLAVGVVFALLLMWFGSRRLGRPLDTSEWILFGLVCWGGVSAGVVEMSPLAGKEAVTGWLIAWCLWIVARRSTPRTARMAAVILIAVGMLVVGGIALEAIGRGGIRVGGLLENPNLAAALLVVAVPLLGVVDRGSARRWPVLVAAVSLAGGIALSGSRAGLLALLATLAVLLPRDRTRAVGLALGAVAVVSILSLRFVSQPDVLAWFRPSIWLALLRLWSMHPFIGVGPGGLGDAAGSVRLLHDDHIGHHQFLVTYAEASPLGLLVQVGAVGAVIAVLAVIVWVRRTHRDGAFAFAPLRALVVGMVVMAAFHDFMTIEVVLWWWAVALGVTEAASEQPVLDSLPTAERTWTSCVRGLVLGLVVLWGIVQPAWARWLWNAGPQDVRVVNRATAAEPWFDDPLTWRARVLLDNPAWTWPMAAEALAVSSRAVRIHPGASRSWLILGQVRYRIISEFGSWPGGVAEARAAFVRASELEPLLPWPWLEWARLERGLGNLDEAVFLTRKALDTEPHTVRAWLFLARIELDRGNVRSAREALESAAASTVLRKRAGLTTYEKELLAAPMWQFREIEEAVR